MNELASFKDEKLGVMRTVIKEEEIYFNLSDVCKILDIGNHRDVKNRLLEKGVDTIDTPTNGGIQPMLYINESNLYKTIFQSRKREAEQFTEWVTGEILPSIRKNGIYATENTIDQILNDPDFGIKLLTNLKEEKAKNRKLELDNKVKDQQIQELQPKATYYELVLQCRNLVSATVIAKDFGLTARELNILLHEWGIQFKQKEIWLLYKEYANKGYTQTKTNNIVRSDGTPDTTIHTYWTQKGRLFLYDLLKSKGYLPNIEKSNNWNLI